MGLINFCRNNTKPCFLGICFPSLLNQDFDGQKINKKYE